MTLSKNGWWFHVPGCSINEWKIISSWLIKLVTLVCYASGIIGLTRNNLFHFKTELGTSQFHVFRCQCKQGVSLWYKYYCWTPKIQWLLFVFTGMENRRTPCTQTSSSTVVWWHACVPTWGDPPTHTPQKDFNYPTQALIDEMFLSPQSAMDPAAGRFLSPSSAEQQPSGSGSRFLTPSAAEPAQRHGRRLSFMRRLSSRIMMHDEEEGETTPTMASKQDCFRVHIIYTEISV